MGCSGHGRHLNRGGEPPIGGGRHRGCTHGGRLNEVPSEGPSSLEILQLQCAVHVILTRNWDCQRAHLEKGNSRGVMRDRPGWALAPEATPKVEGTQEPRSHWNRVKNPGTLRSSKDRDQPPCSGPVDSRAPGTGSALAYTWCRPGPGQEAQPASLAPLPGWRQQPQAFSALSSPANTQAPEAGTERLLPPHGQGQLRSLQDQVCVIPVSP